MIQYAHNRYTKSKNELKRRPVQALGFQLRGTARRRDVGAPALSMPTLITSFVLGMDVKATVL